MQLQSCTVLVPVVIVLLISSYYTGPGEVSHVMVVTRFTSITVDWQEPSEPNGVIIEYDLVYNKTLTEFVTINDIRPLTDITPSISVSNLTTDQTVTVRVRAYTRIGPGPYVTRHATTRNKPRKYLFTLIITL